MYLINIQLYLYLIYIYPYLYLIYIYPYLYLIYIYSYLYLIYIQLSEENSVQSAEFLISILGLANTFPRVILGAISDHPKISPLVVTGISTFSCEFALN